MGLMGCTLGLRDSVWELLGECWSPLQMSGATLSTLNQCGESCLLTFGMVPFCAHLRTEPRLGWISRLAEVSAGMNSRHAANITASLGARVAGRSPAQLELAIRERQAKFIPKVQQVSSSIALTLLSPRFQCDSS